MKIIFLLVFMFLQREISGLISSESTRVAALGRTARLGDLYDARRDDFIGISLNNFISSDDVQVSDDAHSTVDYVRTECLSEKSNKLGASPALSISILGGQLPVSGSGEYLNQDKKSSKSAKASLIYKTRTANENLQIFSKPWIWVDLFLLEYAEATHVVVGLEWGADVVLSLEETNTDYSNIREIQGKLEDALETAAHSISEEVDLGYLDVENSSSFGLYLHGDILPNRVPQTINGSIAFIKNLHEIIEKENNGKGKIMSYILMPISTVQKVLISKTNISGEVKDMDQVLIDQFMTVFQELKDSELKINDAYNDMAKWTFMIPEKDFKNVSNVKRQFRSFTNEFRAKFWESVVRYRNGESNDQILEELITSYEQSDWTPESVDKLLETYAPTLNKIELINLFQSFNAKFLDRKTNKYKILRNSYHKEIRIISIDLSTNVSSAYVHGIVKLLEGNGSEAINYYIEDDPNLKIPNVKAYLEGNLIDRFSVIKTEYIILISAVGEVKIIDGNTYDEITAYKELSLIWNSYAVINDTLYSINTRTGIIKSTNVKNLIAPPKDGIKWNPVGFFPNETSYARSVAAVNGSIFYFSTTNGILYKYDTVLKTTTKCASHGGDSSYRFIIVNRVLYIYQFLYLFSFDGTELKRLTVPERRDSPGLFEFEGSVCIVGGDKDFANVTKHPVYCYDSNKEKWNTMSYINQVRNGPITVTTSSGTVIYGGYGVNSAGESVYLTSAEFFNPKTKEWSYIRSPSEIQQKSFLAISIRF